MGRKRGRLLSMLKNVKYGGVVDKTSYWGRGDQSEKIKPFSF